MDLLYWINIIELGEDTDIIIENTDLKKFNKIFDEHSLFHYFSSNPEVINAINKKYRSEQEHGILSPEEKLMPLLILHPDRKGLTALDKSIMNHRPKCFKCMVDLLSDISIDFCLSKLMLDILPMMI